MARFFTSDLHFKHRNIIPYCLRPYENVDEMGEAIIKQWNSQVKPDDDVWVLGDFSINKKTVLDKSIVSRLNGNKKIILGNHDTGFNTLHKNIDCVDAHIKIAKKYLEAGWCFVDIVKYLMLKDGTHIVMTHLPPDNGYDSRYSQYKLTNNPAFNYVHGHLHGHYRKKNNMVDVCYDGDLKLLSEEELIELVNSKEAFIPTRLTDHYAKTNPIMLKPFEEEVQNKNVRRFESEDGKLVGYNYTDQCAYDRAWNDVTLNSRGIVFEKETGKLVALPFSKFFNINEVPETTMGNLPDEPYTITEKMDGSLGIIYNYNGKWRVNTRGSFSSEQAQRASEILKKYNMTNIKKDHTILVEIIYPENKIVVDYGNEEKLVILSVISTDTQQDLHPYDIGAVAELSGMPMAKEYSYTIDEMIELQKSLPKDEEGFVVRFSSGLRVKIKGQEYLRVHKLISQISPLSFFECMENGKVRIDYLHELPEEFREEAEALTKTLEKKYSDVELQIKHEVDACIKKIGFVTMEDPADRKRVGLYVSDAKPRHGSAIFSTLLNDKNRLDKYIMKQIRPHANKLEK